MNGRTQPCPWPWANPSATRASTSSVVRRPVGTSGASSRERAMRQRVEAREQREPRERRPRPRRPSVASTASSREPSKSGSPGMFLISTSAAARPDRQRSASSRVGTSVSPAVGRRDPQPLDLGQVQVPDQAGPVRGPGDVGVVHDHGHVVGRHPYVELDHVGSRRDGRFERRDRVLGLVRRVAAVRHDQSLPTLLTESSFRHYARLGSCPQLARRPFRRCRPHRTVPHD